MRSKASAFALAMAVSLGAGSSAFGQANITSAYTTTFDANQGYGDGNSLSGSQNGTWDTNDPDKTPTTTGYSGEFVGQSDFVGQIQGYTPGYNPTATPPTNGTDFYAYLGGGQHGTTTGTVLPGAPVVYDFHTFGLGTTNFYAFNVDMSIATSTAFPNRDSFGFTFLTSSVGTAVGTNLFSLNFTPATTTDRENISYSINGGAPVTPATAPAVFYNSIYHLSITVNVTTKMANITFTPTGTNPAFSINNINLSAIGNLDSVAEIAPTWTLSNTTKDANGGYTGAGGNELIINNYAVTVPEPSTWAMLGAGALMVAAFARRRARA